MTLVAQTHARNLFKYYRSRENADCTGHSWFPDPNKDDIFATITWADCCYPSIPDASSSACMALKGSEITKGWDPYIYQGPTFENYFAGFGFKVTPEVAVNQWKASPGHNALMLGMARPNMPGSLPLNACGGDIQGAYAVLWMGKMLDKAPIDPLVTTPTPFPSVLPTPFPTFPFQPTFPPTPRPSPTPLPTLKPTPLPTLPPTPQPTLKPTPQPTLPPTPQPTLLPTPQPTLKPTLKPTLQPTLKPTPQPTLPPTLQPTLPPTPQPTLQPTFQPTLPPTPPPTLWPTFPQPTPRPSVLPTIAGPTLWPTFPPPTPRPVRVVTTPEITETEVENNNLRSALIGVVVTVIILCMLAGGGYAFYKRYKESKTEKEVLRGIERVMTAEYIDNPEEAFIASIKAMAGSDDVEIASAETVEDLDRIVRHRRYRLREVKYDNNDARLRDKIERIEKEKILAEIEMRVDYKLNKLKKEQKKLKKAQAKLDDYNEEMIKLERMKARSRHNKEESS
jgi:hypothetical protein